MSENQFVVVCWQSVIDAHFNPLSRLPKAKVKYSSIAVQLNYYHAQFKSMYDPGARFTSYLFSCDLPIGRTNKKVPDHWKSSFKTCFIQNIKLTKPGILVTYGMC